MMISRPLHRDDDRTAPSNRPLDLGLTLGAAWRRLPLAVRRRFAPAHDAVTYQGRIDLHCSPMGRVFAWFARAFGSPLCSERCESRPATVRVRPDGQGGMVWERHFQGTRGRDHVVRSTKALDQNGQLWERTDGGLRMRLEVREEQGALVFVSRCYALELWGRLVPVPMLLTPGRCRVTHLDLGGGRFRFTMEMRHPLWGRTFFQQGDFADPPARTCVH